MDRYLILIDTNAIISANYKITSPALKEFLRNKYHKIVISQVCFDETIRSIVKKKESVKKDFEKVVKDAMRYGFSVDEDILGESNLEIEFNREISDLNFNVLGIQEADLEFIYKKSMGLKKPFKKKNEKESGGIKDNIIWSSYINYLKEEHDNFDKIIFVNNDSDYVIRTETEISLADDLLRDLDEYKIDKEKVTVVSDFRDLNEKILQPVLPVVKVFNIQLRDNIKMVLHDVVDDFRQEIKTAIENSVYESINGDTTEPNFNVIEPSGSIIFPEKMKDFGDNEIYLYFTQIFLVQFEYFLHKTEVFELEGVRHITIVDPDWNEWVMLVEEEWFANVGFEVTLNIKDPHNIKIVDSYLHEEMQIKH
ncbi:PIN domain-containing protein [Rossellomorea marisflavi]|uniref:PIN domain-containing protein n=1 Tax=Rossellomorea marisflavi TaxID=189381 RepID=UPI003D2A391E